jgi:hypothetical protein
VLLYSASFLINIGMSPVEHLMAGLAMVFVFACIITLAIYWLIFPWMMLKKANEILAELRRLNGKS